MQNCTVKKESVKNMPNGPQWVKLKNLIYLATASYRLLPEIKILKPITGKDAEKFKNCFPKGVVEVIKREDGTKEAHVVNPRKDTVSREVLRHAEFEGKVALNRIRDHFICTCLMSD